MKNIQRFINIKWLTVPLAGFIVLALTFAIAPDSSAQLTEGLQAAGQGDGMEANVNINDVVKNIVSIFLYVIGVVAVIMIIFSGFQYLTSAGSSEKAKKAQTTLIYAIVGLVVAIFALAIINFVLNRVGTGTP